MSAVELCESVRSVGDCLSGWTLDSAADYAVDGIVLLTAVLHCFFFAFVQMEGSVQRTVTDHRLIFEHFRSGLVSRLMLVVVLPVDLLAIPLGYVTCFRY